MLVGSRLLRPPVAFLPVCVVGQVKRQIKIHRASAVSLEVTPSPSPRSVGFEDPAPLCAVYRQFAMPVQVTLLPFVGHRLPFRIIKGGGFVFRSLFALKTQPVGDEVRRRIKRFRVGNVTDAFGLRLHVTLAEFNMAFNQRRRK